MKSKAGCEERSDGHQHEKDAVPLTSTALASSVVDETKAAEQANKGRKAESVRRARKGADSQAGNSLEKRIDTTRAADTIEYIILVLQKARWWDLMVVGGKTKGEGRGVEGCLGKAVETTSRRGYQSGYRNIDSQLA